MIFPNPHRVQGTNAYCNCKWCRGNGCLQCAVEEEKAYRAAFPNGPQPIATIAHDGTDEGIAAVLAKLLSGLNEAAEERAMEKMPDAHHICSQIGMSDDQIKSGMIYLSATEILEERAVAMEREQKDTTEDSK